MAMNSCAAITGSNFPLSVPIVSYPCVSASVSPVTPSTNDFDADFNFSNQRKEFDFTHENSNARVNKALEELNKKLAGSTRLEFTLDHELGIMVISILNNEGSTIRSIPNETSLKIAKMLAEFKGCVIEDTV